MTMLRTCRFGQLLVFTGAVLLLTNTTGYAQTTDAGTTPAARAGVPVAAKVKSIKGALLKKAKGQWAPVNETDKIASGQALVSFPKTIIQSPNGAVEIMMISDIGKRLVYPILETAVVVKRTAKVDVDLTFQRGLIVLTNTKKRGAAKVRLRFQTATWDLTLSGPGTKVVAELYSRLPAGLLDFKSLKKQGPTVNLAVLVVKGKTFVDTKKVAFGLTEPPGAALLLWDSLVMKPHIERLAKLPEEIRPADEKEKHLLEKVRTCVSCLMAEKMDKALDTLIKSDDKIDRLVGVTMMGAVDDLPRVLDALTHPKDADVRDHAVLVLRNWLGREKGQVAKLFNRMARKKKFSRIQTLSILQMLFGFDEKQLQNPITYQVLLLSLDHKQLAIRELAHWHLVRIEPEGKKIGYDAGAPAPQRRKAIARWRKLIPAGQLPKALRPVQDE